MIIRPENEKTTLTVSFSVQDAEATASFIKDETFRSLIKKSGFHWSSGRSAWAVECSNVTGDVRDRVADAMARCLKNGLPVSCDDDEAVRRLKEGDYETFHPRWIVSYPPHIGILWFSGDWYDAAKNLPGAKPTRSPLPLPAICVPVNAWDYIVSFAETNGFRIEEKAQAILNKARADYMASLFMRDIPSPRKKEAKESREGLLDD